MRCYTLIKAGHATMYELKNWYTLDEMLKLYALFQMEQDIQAGQAEEARRETER